MTRRLVASSLAALAIVAFQLVPVLAHDDPIGSPDVTITIGGGFSDRVVQVGPGAVVRFVNRDGERHRIRSRSGDRGFDTGNLDPGESAQVRLTTAGTYTYLDDRERDDTRYHGRILVGGNGRGGTAGADGTEPTPRDGVTGPIPQRATVTIGDRVFQPGTTTVAVGGTVTFRNEDGDEHTANGTGGIDSGTLASGATYQKRFDEAGTYDFLCAFHSDMRGSIEVVAETAAAPWTPTPKPTVVPSPTPTATTAPAGSGGGTTTTVDVVDFDFEPATLEVAAGGTVAWTNTGVAPHTVSAKDGSFGSELLDAGATFEHTFTTPGTYAYLCQVHPEMTGTVEVVSREPEPVAPAAAATGPTSTAPSTKPASTTTPSQGALPGVVLSVTLVGIASALFARLLRGTANRR